jgi:hypothetical protein
VRCNAALLLFLKVIIMKTNATFKLSKSTKRILSTLTGESRTIFKKAMIDAEYTRSTGGRVILTGRETVPK